MATVRAIRPFRRQRNIQSFPKASLRTGVAAAAGRIETVSGFTGTLGEKPFGCWNMLDSTLEVRSGSARELGTRSIPPGLPDLRDRDTNAYGHTRTSRSIASRLLASALND